MKWSKKDMLFMKRALRLAMHGEGKVSPNPLVGAVVVKGKKIIGEGWHERFGGPHAEAIALRGIDARGATLYVTLEPCCPCVSLKKTPACVPLVFKSGVKRVVIAARDIHPQVCGIEELRSSGVQVEEGLLEDEARKLNEVHEVFFKAGRAFCALKIAQSANGKIGVRKAGKVQISGKAFDCYVHQLRNRYDAILVGANTIIEDDPLLTCRAPGGRNPARIILDSRLRIPLHAKALQNAKKDRVIIATTDLANPKKARELKRKGVALLRCGKSKVDVKKLLYLLPKLGLFSVLVEGGAKAAQSFLSAGIVDRLVVAVSPKKINGPNAVSSPVSREMLRKMPYYRCGRDRVYDAYLTSYSK
ncbi:MAG: bifunctional diaminohydroxyphosphoribosylaminopyrimidine deaminase/5-amino-6-(5-phosphoribosylamino)uracil reductase RibD [Candidatus Micrarchaeota archaeon]|nr:bifunctional diaminohydroxyphosphoribosylaminopyrimidine deaminase/5-amino-6-(5-phosphoribosylamino)uracil reductase RibD [Candidatus Micrarchaeota archaeon]